MSRKFFPINSKTALIILLSLFGVGIFFAQKVVAMILIGGLTQFVFMFLGNLKGQAGKISHQFGIFLIVAAGTFLIGSTTILFPLMGLLPLFLALPFILGYLSVKAGALMEKNFPIDSNYSFKACFYPILFLILIIIPWQFNDFFAGLF